MNTLLVYSRLDRLGDCGVGTLYIGIDLTVPAAKSESRQFTIEPVNVCLDLSCTSQIMAALGLGKRGV